MSLFTEGNFTKCSDHNIYTGIETILRVILEELFKQNAIDGMTVVDVASGLYTDEEFYGFVVRENTVVSTLTAEGLNVLDDYNISARTLTTCDPAIMAPMNKPFTGIQLQSGSVWVLLKL